MRDPAKMIRIKFLTGRRFLTSLAVVLLLLVGVVVYPFQMTIVPEWKLRVITDAGSPVGEINVTEHWQHYLFERHAHEDAQKTGVDGRVSFPERTLRASVLKRVMATVGRRRDDGSHARNDPAASIVVWGSKDHQTTVAVYKEGETPKTEIIVQTLR